MDKLINSPEEHHRIAVYNEYLKKLPQLLQQLETVEAMYEKAVLEEQMLPRCGGDDRSTQLYAKRLASTKEQCITRAADIRQQCRLIFALKAQIEQESTTLQAFIK